MSSGENKIRRGQYQAIGIKARSQILCLYKETQSMTIPVQIADWATCRLASQRSHYDSGTENLLLAVLKSTPSGKARL